MTRQSSPSGAAPYSAALISLSVPSTPTRSTRTSTPRPFEISSSDGFGNSVRCSEFGWPGNTANALIAIISMAGLESPTRTTLQNQFRHQPGPSGLMAGASAPAVVAVEVLVEEDQVAPMWIALELFVLAMHRPSSVGIAEERTRQSPSDLVGDFGERHEHARPGWTLHHELRSEIV